MSSYYVAGTIGTGDKQLVGKIRHGHPLWSLEFRQSEFEEWGQDSEFRVREKDIPKGENNAHSCYGINADTRHLPELEVIKGKDWVLVFTEPLMPVPEPGTESLHCMVVKRIHDWLREKHNTTPRIKFKKNHCLRTFQYKASFAKYLLNKWPVYHTELHENHLLISCVPASSEILLSNDFKGQLKMLHQKAAWAQAGIGKN